MNQYLLRENLPQTTEGEMDTYPELLRDLLRARGIMSREQAEQFLNPDYDRDNHHPYRMKDMERAVERVLKAISEKQKIIIYSDYDADGIPGAVVLHDIFKKSATRILKIIFHIV